MRGPGLLRFYQTPDRIDLLIGNRSALAPGADKSEYSVHTQNAQTLHSIGDELREDITTEQRYLYRLLAIAPSVHFGNKREEGRDASLIETMGNNFLVPGARLQPIPILGFDLWKWLRHLEGYTADGHSFAL
jgi:hypothetical protein